MAGVVVFLDGWQVHRAGGVRYLLALLGVGKAQEYACRALAHLAHNNATIQQEICRSGGIAMLLAPLSGLNTEGQIYGCAALAELAQGANGKSRRKTQDAIAKAGGIGPLLQLIESRYQVRLSVRMRCITHATAPLTQLPRLLPALSVASPFPVLNPRDSASLDLSHTQRTLAIRPSQDVTAASVYALAMIARLNKVNNNNINN